MKKSEAFLLFSGGKIDHKYLTAFAALKLMTDGPKKNSPSMERDMSS